MPHKLVSLCHLCNLLFIIMLECNFTENAFAMFTEHVYTNTDIYTTNNAINRETEKDKERGRERESEKKKCDIINLLVVVIVLIVRKKNETSDSILSSFLENCPENLFMQALPNPACSGVCRLNKLIFYVYIYKWLDTV